MSCYDVEVFNYVCLHACMFRGRGYGIEYSFLQYMNNVCGKHGNPMCVC